MSGNTRDQGRYFGCTNCQVKRGLVQDLVTKITMQIAVSLN